MFACVIYWCDNSQKVIPINWIYRDRSKILRRKSYLAFYFPNIKKHAPPIKELKRNHSNKLVVGQVHAVFVYDLVGNSNQLLLMCAIKYVKIILFLISR